MLQIVRVKGELYEEKALFSGDHYWDGYSGSIKMVRFTYIIILSVFVTL